MPTGPVREPLGPGRPEAAAQPRPRSHVGTPPATARPARLCANRAEPPEGAGPGGARASPAAQGPDVGIRPWVSPPHGGAAGSDAGGEPPGLKNTPKDQREMEGPSVLDGRRASRLGGSHQMPFLFNVRMEPRRCGPAVSVDPWVSRSRFDSPSAPSRVADAIPSRGRAGGRPRVSLSSMFLSIPLSLKSIKPFFTLIYFPIDF